MTATLIATLLPLGRATAMRYNTTPSLASPCLAHVLESTGQPCLLQAADTLHGWHCRCEWRCAGAFPGLAHVRILKCFFPSSHWNLGSHLWSMRLGTLIHGQGRSQRAGLLACLDCLRKPIPCRLCSYSLMLACTRIWANISLSRPRSRLTGWCWQYVTLLPFAPDTMPSV